MRNPRFLFIGAARWPMDTRWGKRWPVTAWTVNMICVFFAVVIVGTALIWAIGWVWSGGRVD